MKRFKSGFTMSELIIVLVIIGVLGYITFNKLFGAKTKQEIENAVKADLEVITNAADKFRLNTRDGRYTGLTMSKIAGSFPNNMKQMNETGALGTIAGTHEWAGSISFGEMCRYAVSSNNGDSDRTFNIVMNCKPAVTNLGWNDSEAALTEQVFWEFVNRKYGYSAGKGLVQPGNAADALESIAPSATGVSALYNINLAADVPPTTGDKNGIAFATDLRGF